jgi:uncharacterized protein YciI
MYALAIVRYRRPLDEVLVHWAAHHEYLQALKAEGLLIASGPLEPRFGGALLLRVPDGDRIEATLDRVRDSDPYWKAGVAQYEVLACTVTPGRPHVAPPRPPRPRGANAPAARRARRVKRTVIVPATRLVPARAETVRESTRR